MKKPTKSCFLCDGGVLRAGLQLDKNTIDGVIYQRELPAEICDQCGEVFLEASDLVAFEREIAVQLLATQAAGPDAFRLLRSVAVGVEAQVFAAAIHTTASTLSRWENGKAPINGAAFEVVRLLAAQRLGVNYTTPMNVGHVVHFKPRKTLKAPAPNVAAARQASMPRVATKRGRTAVG